MAERKEESLLDHLRLACQSLCTSVGSAQGFWKQLSSIFAKDSITMVSVFKLRRAVK
jgi:hypothetical protein